MPALLPDLERSQRPPPASGGAAAPARRAAAWARRRRQRPHRPRAPLGERSCPTPSSSRPTRPSRCDMAPFGRQWFSLQNRDARPASSPASRARRRSSTPISTRRWRRAASTIRAARAGRIFARHDDGALCRSAARQAAGRDRRLFRRAGRARTAGRRDPLAAAGAPRPWRCRRGGAGARARRPRSQALEAAGVPVEQLLRPGLGHGIDDEGLRARRRVPARWLRAARLRPPLSPRTTASAPAR